MMAQLKKAQKAANAKAKVNNSKVMKNTRKNLKKAQAAQLKAEAKAFAAKRKLLAIKRAQKAKLRAARAACNGKCDREFPIVVGPMNVPAKQTRQVVVIGDRAENKKVWSRVHTPRKWLWDAKKLKKTKRHIRRAGQRIVAARSKTKRISDAPLVEKPL